MLYFLRYLVVLSRGVMGRSLLLSEAAQFLCLFYQPAGKAAEQTLLAISICIEAFEMSFDEEWRYVVCSRRLFWLADFFYGFFSVNGRLFCLPNKSDVIYFTRTEVIKMKLNPDCIRDILLAVETICDTEHYFNSRMDLDKIHGNYSVEEIAYHARQCDMAGMFYKFKRGIDGGWEVVDLTPRGHEFLANIREDMIWNNVKTVSSKVGSKSLNAISQIASAVVTEIIKSQLGLH